MCFPGCDKVKDAFGLKHNTPDELALMDQPDLIVPPTLTKPPTSSILDANQILKGGH